jgi:hypothetical protein
MRITFPCRISLRICTKCGKEKKKPTFVVHYLANQVEKHQPVFSLRRGYYRASTDVLQSATLIWDGEPTHVSLLDCFREVGRAQVNSNVMIALRTSPLAPSTIEFSVFGKSRTLANAVTRFTAQVSSVGAIGLNLRAPVGFRKQVWH